MNQIHSRLSVRSTFTLLALAASGLCPAGAFAADGTASYVRSDVGNAAVLVFDGDAAKALYQDMTQVPEESVDVGGSFQLQMRIAANRNFGCFRAKEQGKEEVFSCLMGFEDVTHGEMTVYLEQFRATFGR